MGSAVRRRRAIGIKRAAAAAAAAAARRDPRAGGSGGGMRVRALDGRQLRKLLRKAPGRCLVLDTRPYLAFSASCLRGSLNVNLNAVVLRRARGGPVPLRFVVPDEAARARLLLPPADGAGLAAVVVLDQGSAHWRALPKDSPAHIVLDALLRSLPEPGARVCFLRGECVRLSLPAPRLGVVPGARQARFFGEIRSLCIRQARTVGNHLLCKRPASG